MSTIDRKFFDTIYHGLETGYISVWDRQKKHTEFYKVGIWDTLLADVERRVQQKRDVYFCVCPLAHPVEEGRGKEQDVVAITSLFADIDIVEGLHKSGRSYPETVDKALELLTPFPKPSILVHSGGGLHVYWLLDKPLIIQNEEDRAVAKRLLSGFQNAIIQHFNAHGYEMDHTGDLARVLRIPGTFNFKDADNPKEVRILYSWDNRYTVEQFTQYKGIAGELVKTDNVESEDLVDGDVNVLAKRCAFIQHCVKEAGDLKEPLWHAAIDNIALVKDSNGFIHTMSQPHPKYSEKETDEKIGHAREHKTPHTCRFIRSEKIGFQGCPPRGCPVEAPIGWLSSRHGLAYDKVLSLLEQEKLDRREVWDEAVQDALTEIKLHNEANYRGVLQKIRDRVPNFGVNDYKASINDRIKRKIQQQNENNNLVLAELSAQLGYEVKLPDGYYFDENGQLIYRSFTRTELVAMQPVGIASQYVNDAGEKLDSIIFPSNERNGKWSQLLVKPWQIANVHKIIELANYGLLVDSTNSIFLVGFLTKFKKANAGNIKPVWFTSQLGWQEDKSFFPGLSNYRFIRQGHVTDETESYEAKGSLEDWTRLAGPARQSAGARLGLAASFAAPLVKLAKSRTHIIHIWGPSRGGKTASQVLAASVWLNPKKAMISFNSTKVGLERQLGFFSNLPVIIDERQVVGDNQQLLDMLIYMIGEGKGRTRGTKGGTVQHGEEWETICLTSGEHPLSAQSSAAGAKTRSLEPFFGKVVDDQEFAARLHVECQKNYGTAGPAFLSNIIKDEGVFADVLRSWSDYVKGTYKDVNPAHRSYLGLLAATDYLVSTIIWNMPKTDAEAETKHFLNLWKKALDITGETEEIHRVRAYIEGWLVQNERHFSDTGIKGLSDPGVNGDRYGWYLPDGNVGIVPTVFQQALRSNGFHWDRVKVDFAKQGWLKTANDRRSISYTVTRNIPGQGTVRLVELIRFRTEEISEQPVQADEIKPLQFEEDGSILN